jgi:cyclic-di-GMP-binding biofilm dispersal mediator protein
MMAINHLGPAAIVAGLLPQLQATEPGSAFVLGMSGVVVEQTFAGMSAYTASKTAHSSFLQTLSREWRRHKIAAIDVRLGHTETGLATRPLFGTAPQMPSGHDPDKAVAVIMAAIAERATVVPATAFS